MKVWLSDYQLEVKATGEKRGGYLLKLQSDDFEAGYADLFPWQAFGDPFFEDIPQLIKKQQSFPLLERSLKMAEKDGKARELGESLLDGVQSTNHFLVTDLEHFLEDDLLEALENGFQRFKFKVCRNMRLERQKLNQWLPHLTKGQMVRLDCNTFGSNEFLEMIEPFKDVIEYIEDPLAKHFWPVGWPWAFDHPGFEYRRVKTPWQVIKPAKQAFTEAEAPNIVFTSYLDHPVGQAHAAHEASLWGEQKHDYGLLSQHIYKETAFHGHLVSEGPELSFVSGTGIGFDDLWETLEWQEVVV